MIKDKLRKIKNSNPWVKWLWFKGLKRRARKANSEDLATRMTNIFNAGHSFPLDLEKPRTYSDKLNWMKLYYRNPLMPVVSDKFEVRKYLENLGYGYLLNDLLGVWDNVKDMDIKSLPERFVLKSTHGSGPSWIKIVEDKKKVKWYPQKLIMKQWLKNTIDWMGGEWHYGEMKPRIIAEKFLEDKNARGLTDYKIHCFNGKAAFVMVCVGRAEGNLKFYCMTPDWELLRINRNGVEAPEGFKPPKPENVDEMVRIAEDLAKPFPVVRMDFYDVDGKIYFGEFTFFESGGFDKGYTYEGQNIVGNMITLPEPNISSYRPSVSK